MSNVYNLEPPTKGKVILKTTLGDIDIELWAKEAPKAVRNFVQLCMEGYYDGTMFHRILKDFMAQGGDASGSGAGEESIYGHPFPDEFHSRLKFSHRGLVACANAGTPHTNGSQFFITLDRCDHLDRKHTIFGKVTGESIYNCMHLNDLETGEDDRPTHPPVIKEVEVLWNPFDDIIPRSTREEREAEAAARKEKKSRKKNTALLSFGEEAETEDA
ncbi:cyclophilin-like protein, partial [Coccomyxa subellipsoidea C-169]